MNENNEAWYRKSWGVGLLIWLFFPVGLYLMWKHTTWNKKLKWGITGVFALLILLSVVSLTTAQEPTITLDAFKDNQTVTSNSIEVKGKVEPSTSTVRVNGHDITPENNGAFKYAVALKVGSNSVDVEANNAGKTSNIKRVVVREITAEEKAAQATAAKQKSDDEKRAAEAKQEATKPLDAKVNYGWGGVQLVNNETKDWNGCSIELNNGLFGGGYSSKPPTIVAKDTVIIPWTNFTKGDGTRFSYGSTAPKTIDIHCTVEGNRRHANLGN
jgi:sRNA-binding protein